MTLTTKQVDFGGAGEVRFEHGGVAGIITLTRPEALNALTHTMVKAIARALDAWEHDAGVALVIVKAEGRAFSAGGDLREVYERRAHPDPSFFADEYRLNARIESYPKRYIAVIDGIVMGGGVGIAFHGSHRLMTENAVFAMPECGIGFFPDVGASHLLSDLAADFGIYLGLTGARIKQGDALWSGLATYAIRAADQNSAIELLASTGDVDNCSRYFLAMTPRETDRDKVSAIHDWFSAPSAEDIVKRVAASAGTNEFAASLLTTLRSKSPTSLKVAHRSLTRGQTMAMGDCMRMEYRVVNRMLTGHDFYEGIRAVIVDKDNKPVWSPAALEAVTDEQVDAYFAPLPGGDVVL